MRRVEAVRLAAREFARPRCPRCQGCGLLGDASRRPEVCACVTARLPEPAGGAGSDEMPPAWRAITRRAQEIHAAAALSASPDTWG